MAEKPRVPQTDLYGPAGSEISTQPGFPAPGAPSAPGSRLFQAPPPEIQSSADPHADSRPLPTHYNRTVLKLMVRDLEWLFAYWEISNADLKRFALDRAPGLVFRVWTGEVKDAAPGQLEIEEEIAPDRAGSRYIHAGAPGRLWAAELGVLDAAGSFARIARSNPALTPSGRAAPRDTPPVAPEADRSRADEVMRLSGADPAHEAAASMQGMASESLMRSAPPASPEIAGPPIEAQFELVIFGATEPGARLTVFGQPVYVRHDGGFSVRIALPEGAVNIDLRAENPQGGLSHVSARIEKRES